MQSLIGRLALPGLTGKKAEDSIKYNTGRLLNVPRIARGKEWAQVGRELEVLNFRFQVFLKSGAGYWIAGMGHVITPRLSPKIVALVADFIRSQPS